MEVDFYMTKVVFLGDSITDAGRNNTNGSLSSIGQGYPLIVSAALGAKYPSKYSFDNTGISGSRIVDLYARIKTDAWNKEPDLISILIGVNDVWHELGDIPNGVDAERFERVYRMLLSDTVKRFPNVKFLLLEPFVLRASATEEQWDIFQKEVALRAHIVKLLAHEFRASFIGLQEKFDQACVRAPASYWIGDGVHPTLAGHQLIADAWLEGFNQIMEHSMENK